MGEDIWDDLFASCRREAVHLEMRDQYAIHSEQERVARFLARGYADLDQQARERAWWLDLIKNATEAGLSVRRARIVSEPVTDYIRYEHAGTDLNIKAGEEVRWLPRHQASGLALPGNDYWLFDAERVLFNHFDGPGDFTGYEYSDDPPVVQLCTAAFEAVWAKAIPHSQYRPA